MKFFHLYDNFFYLQRKFNLSNIVKKVIGFVVLVCLLVSANFGGDVRISAKSTLVEETGGIVEEPTWWDDVCSWVKSLF